MGHAVHLHSDRLTFGFGIRSLGFLEQTSDVCKSKVGNGKKSMEMNQTFVCLTQIRVPLQDVPVQKQLAISWSSPVTMIHPTYLRQKTDCDAQGINQTFQCYKLLFPKSQHFVHRYLKVDSPIHPCKLSHIPSSQPENVKLFGSQNTNTGHGHDGLASLSLSTLHCAKSTVATRCGCIPVLFPIKQHGLPRWTLNITHSKKVIIC